jgi:hypothetical protein
LKIGTSQRGIEGGPADPEEERADHSENVVVCVEQVK